MSILAKSTLHRWWEELYVTPKPQTGSVFKESGKTGIMGALEAPLKSSWNQKTERVRIKQTNKETGR